MLPVFGVLGLNKQEKRVTNGHQPLAVREAKGDGGGGAVFRSLGSLTVKPRVQNIDSNGAQEN